MKPTVLRCAQTLPCLIAYFDGKRSTTCDRVDVLSPPYSLCASKICHDGRNIFSCVLQRETTVFLFLIRNPLASHQHQENMFPVPVSESRFPPPLPPPLPGISPPYIPNVTEESCARLDKICGEKKQERGRRRAQNVCQTYFRHLDIVAKRGALTAAPFGCLWLKDL